jgi:shikimate kinase
MKHLILIGFKSVGKTTIGRLLATSISRPFVDLDAAIELAHGQKAGVARSCREIMRECGQEYFRALEKEVLRGTINSIDQSVFSLGGGAALDPDNQSLFADHLLIHLTAAKEKILARMLKNGLPAFFPKDCDPEKHFDQLWRERHPVYEKIASLSVRNDQTPEECVATIVAALKNLDLL